MAHCIDILFTYATQYQDDEGADDTAVVCSDLVRFGFPQSIEFYFRELTKSHHESPTNKKRKRLEPESPTSRRGRILSPGYPFLVRIQVMLMNDRIYQARDLASQMESCPAMEDEKKTQAWALVMDYLGYSGKLFLDGNDIFSPAYREKHTLLLTLRAHMKNLGVNVLIDYYKTLIDQVTNDPCSTPEESKYVTVASQHTILRLMMDKMGIDAGIQRTLQEFPLLYVWGSGDLKAWAIKFLQQDNPIPESLLVDGELDMRSLWNRATDVEPAMPASVPAAKEIAAEVVIDVDSADDEVKVVKEARVEVLETDDADDQVEEIYDSDEEDQQQASAGNEVVEIDDSSEDTEESRTEEEESLDSDSAEDDESEPMGRKTREKDDEETADEDDVSALFGSNDQMARNRLQPVGEAIDDFEEVDSYVEEEQAYSDEDAYESEEGEQVYGEEQGVQNASDDEVVVIDDDDDDNEEDTDVDESELEKVAEEDYLEKGYEPDTTWQTEEEVSEAAQTEEEEEKDGLRSTAAMEGIERRKAKVLGSDQIAFRTTFSDMDAADERTEPFDEDESSEVDDRARKGRKANTVDSEASSALVAFAYSAQRKAGDDPDETSPFQRPQRRPQFSFVVSEIPNVDYANDGDDTSAAVAASEAERYLSETNTEEGGVQVVDEVPQIEDVHASDNSTDTVASSDGGGLSNGASMEDAVTVEHSEVEELISLVNQVPNVEDAQIEDDTSAAKAASEEGRYLSEANTENDSHLGAWGGTESAVGVGALDVMEGERVSHPDVQATMEASFRSTEGKTKKPSYGGQSKADRAGYEADIEEKDEAKHPARSAMEVPPGYEADIEEKTPHVSMTETEEGAIPVKSPGYQADPGYETGVRHEDNREEKPHLSVDVPSSPSQLLPTKDPEAKTRDPISWRDSIEAASSQDDKQRFPSDVQTAEKHESALVTAKEVAIHEGVVRNDDDDDAGSAATGSSSVRRSHRRKSSAKKDNDFVWYGTVASPGRTGSHDSKVKGANASAKTNNIAAIDKHKESYDTPSSKASAGSFQETRRSTEKVRTDDREGGGDDKDDAGMPETSLSTQILDSPVRHTRSHDPASLKASARSPPKTSRSTRTARTDDWEGGDDDAGIPETPPSTRILDSSARHTRSHDPASPNGRATSPPKTSRTTLTVQTENQEGSGADKDDEDDTGMSEAPPRSIKMLDSPARHTRSHDSTAGTDSKASAKDKGKKHRTDQQQEEDAEGAASSKASARKPRKTRQSTRVGKSLEGQGVDEDNEDASTTSRLRPNDMRSGDAPAGHTRSHDSAAETDSKASAKDKGTHQMKQEEDDADGAASSKASARKPRKTRQSTRVGKSSEGQVVDEDNEDASTTSKLRRSNRTRSSDAPAGRKRSHDSAAEVDLKASTKGRGKKHKTEQQQEEDDADGAASSKASARKPRKSRQSTRVGKPSEGQGVDEDNEDASTTSKLRRSNRTRSGDAPAGHTSSHDSATETNSKASTRKSGPKKTSQRKSKARANSDNRESLGSNPEGHSILIQEEGDGGSVSSMDSSSVVSRPRRSTRAAAASLATVPEDPSTETDKTVATRSRSRMMKHGEKEEEKETGAAKRRKTLKTQGSESSTNSAGRVTRSSARRRGK